MQVKIITEGSNTVGQHENKWHKILSGKFSGTVSCKETFGRRHQRWNQRHFHQVQIPTATFSDDMRSEVLVVVVVVGMYDVLDDVSVLCGPQQNNRNPNPGYCQIRDTVSTTL
jgi:hypothetical protein